MQGGKDNLSGEVPLPVAPWFHKKKKKRLGNIISLLFWVLSILNVLNKVPI